MPNTILDRIRKWIDADEFLETDRILVQKSVTYESENFLRSLLNQVEGVLLSEMVRLPNGTAYVPARFRIRLAKGGYEKLRTDKRGFLEEAVSELIAEKAQERSGDAKLSSPFIKCCIQAGDTSDIQVEALSESEPKDEDVLQFVADTPKTAPKSHLGDDFHSASTVRETKLLSHESTVDTSFRLKVLYSLEIYFEGRLVQVVPIVEPVVTIGRDEHNGEANIRLKTDNLNVSRVHAGIEYSANGDIRISALAQTGNPTFLSGRPLSRITGESVARLQSGDSFNIYEFEFRLRLLRRRICFDV